MEEQEYRTMYEVEDQHWWYLGLRELVVSFVRNSCKTGHPRILDAGCGTGAILTDLKKFAVALGIDSSKLALEYCKKRGLNGIVQGSVCELPFEANQFDAIVSGDVFYHSNVVDDLQAFRECFRVLKPEGKLILNLPAYEFLRSRHDRAIHTARRYDRKEVMSKLTASGFVIDRLTYRNSVLFPIVLAFRLINKEGGPKGAKSDLFMLPSFLNQFLLKILKFENWAIRKINLPFGSSVFCVASKPGE